MLDRILITGAAGGVATALRPLVAPLTRHLRLSDIAEFEAQGEEIHLCDLADQAAVNELVAGCDAIIHLGGVSVESPFSKILQSNIQGVYNLYEAARKNGKPRIIFASSNHVVGFHEQTTFLDNNAPIRPDGLYGVSKCFGEAMARMYYDKFQVETAVVRIGSCFPEPTNRRMLSTWLSARDFAALIERCFTVPRLGCPIIYGVSANDTVWWSNENVNYLGWRPKDSSEVFQAKVEEAEPAPDRDSAVARLQGGAFTTDPIFEDD
ncbi:NAD(P)-dependent oxidoreductase [Rhodobacteraceae bacterium NNCM2]|nr:NAD(P)-dependent oxidoreductase [Coraliihabitans acroporae]